MKPLCRFLTNSLENVAHIIRKPNIESAPHMRAIGKRGYILQVQEVEPYKLKGQKFKQFRNRTSNCRMNGGTVTYIST